MHLPALASILHEYLLMQCYGICHFMQDKLQLIRIMNGSVQPVCDIQKYSSHYVGMCTCKCEHIMKDICNRNYFYKLE